MAYNKTFRNTSFADSNCRFYVAQDIPYSCNIDVFQNVIMSSYEIRWLILWIMLPINALLFILWFPVSLCYQNSSGLFHQNSGDHDSLGSHEATLTINLLDPEIWDNDLKV